MNRKNLTAAVLAGLAGVAGIVGSAQAVNINPDGLGQVLIYPYYTTNGGNQTILSVVNTSESAKAVKVRFLEGKNSREVLDFNLYMSAYDVWTAAIYDNAGTPTLVTADNTCTVPYIYGNGGTQEFLPYAMTDEVGYNPEELDTLGDISRGSEGHFEMIEMGRLTDEDFGSATAITHVAGELPAGGCAQLVAAWTDPDDIIPDNEGYWLGTYVDDDENQLGAFNDMRDPTGGLFGGAAIVNVTDGTMYSYDAKAVDGFSSYELHNKPGNTEPNLNSGSRTDGNVFTNGDTTSYSFSDGVDAVSYVFMHDSVMNEYTSEVLAGASTEWVVTFPTKHFYVYDGTLNSDPLAPFTESWNGEDACEVVLLDTIWDRNEQQPGTPDDPTGDPIPPIVSPAPPQPDDPTKPAVIPFELCYETNVIQFVRGEASIDSGTGILGSTNFHSINHDTELFSSEHGWARFEMDDFPWDKNGNGVVECDEDLGLDAECFSRDPLGNLEGLPVTGFAVQSFQNSFLGDGNDVLANYGGIFQHKGTRKLGSNYKP